MSRLTLLILEDEPEVRQALERDLEDFSPTFDIEAAEEVPEARELIREKEEEGNRVALILCDHILPGQLGVDFLIELNKDEETKPIRKVLVTGQASHEDTVAALNRADLHRYIAKPWEPERLKEVVIEQLTEYVIEQVKDPTPYIQVLDGPRILESMGGLHLPD